MAGAVLLGPTGAQADVGDGPGGLIINPTSGSTTAPSMGGYTIEHPCPADFRLAANIQVALEEEPPVPTGAQLSANLFGLTDDPPPPGQLDAFGIGGLAQLFRDTGLTSGDHMVALLCYNDEFVPFAAATTWIHVDLQGGTWNVIEGGGEDPEPVTTTTSLEAQPSTAQAGQPVTLTATVTGTGAAGSVEFLNGTASLGTDDVASGKATLTVASLPVGAHSLTAKFTPADPEDFTPSTSSEVTVTITESNGGGSGNQQLNVTVPPSEGDGELTLEVGGAPVDLEPVSGQELAFEGQLSEITVNDDRDQLAGWDLTGFTTDFSGDDGSFGGENLGWEPAVIEPNAANDVELGDPVAAGNPGIKETATLATADAGKGAGSCTLGGTLNLQVPAETPAGDYSATLTVTLLSK
ncbi:hypothetical protein GCM10022251_42200 [Phytohabitans flavus]|uniref:Bacterial Ig-like domain-containing protein n=1 Tax=Phytohabitans flavus TaxID=1076124 RepID=A0A6F8Y0E7_9ACTN|nr:Ig-like domain-containing protein [Phytohabitans flavus]BCB79533.1 hypothetical protein Pflav_059430 [Phytohabitans flavus]